MKRALLFWIPFAIFGADLGVRGETFLVVEDPYPKTVVKDLPEPFSLESYAPKGCDLPSAKKIRVYYVEPGKEQGVQNPLKSFPLQKPLLFFNGEDHEQTKWAQNQEGTLISCRGLVKGAFFDQRGELVGLLGIQALPAKVIQEGIQLRIVEGMP